MTGNDRVGKLTITVLVDNLPGEGLQAEWGLSVLIDADGRQILLDTGASSLFAENAHAMGIPLDCVEAGVLSHAHYDHADGLDRFFEENRKAKFYLRESCRENCFSEREDGSVRYIGICKGALSRHSDRIVYVSGTEEIAPGIWLIGHRKADYTKIAIENKLYTAGSDTLSASEWTDEGVRKIRKPDDFSHEQSLVVRTENGLVIFNSCSHTGVQNIISEVREALGEEKICAYIGGMHLYRLSDEQILSLADYLEKESIGRIYTGHCSGEHGYELLSQRLKGRIVQFYSGLDCRIV